MKPHPATIALLLAPTVLIVTGIAVTPMLYAIYVSLHGARYLVIDDFVGFSNYLRLLRDPQTIAALATTLKYVFGSLIIVIPFAFILASVLNRPIRFIPVFRTIVLLPWILSEVVVAMLWAWILSASFGPVNYLLVSLGLERVRFFSTPELALPTVILINTWWSYALPTVLLLAGLQTVPHELYESAKVDGANLWVVVTKITLPIISTTLLITIILVTLLYFNRLTIILVLTGGGPLRATETLALRTYLEGFQSFRMGLSASLGVLIFLCNLAFSMGYIRVIRRDVTQ